MKTLKFAQVGLAAGPVDGGTAQLGRERKITPLGLKEGEFFKFDRAMIF